MKDNIATQLNKIKVKQLDEFERNQLWQNIVVRLPNSQTSYFFLPLIFKSKIMLSIFIVLMLALGGTATVQAADQALPGDILYSLDRTIENVQLKFSNQGKKDELKIKFSQERVDEVGSVISKLKKSDANLDNSSTSTTTTTASFSSKSDLQLQTALGEAVNFIDQVKLDLEASGNTEAVLELNQLLDRLGENLQTLSPHTKFEIKMEDNNDALQFEIKSKEQGEQKVELKLRSSEETGDRLRIKNSEQEFEIEFKNSSTSSVTSTSDNSRDLIEVENNPISISSTSLRVLDSESSDDTSGSAGESSGGQDNVQVFIERIEAEAGQDSTKVRVKYQGQDDQYFNLNTTSRAEVISQLAIKYGLSEIKIESLLKFEISE
jgi:hypothetical protein